MFLKFNKFHWTVFFYIYVHTKCKLYFLTQSQKKVCEMPHTYNNNKAICLSNYNEHPILNVGFVRKKHIQNALLANDNECDFFSHEK